MVGLAALRRGDGIGMRRPSVWVAVVVAGLAGW